MASFLNVILVFFLFKTSNCEWSLIWHDEFNESVLNHTNWRVTNGKGILDDSANEEVLSFSRDSPKNIDIFDGVLAITAVQEYNHGKYFTTAYLDSKKAFRYGKVDVRAALPKDSHLKTSIILLPEKDHYGRGQVSGEIEIVADIQQDQHYYSRVSYNDYFKAEKSFPYMNDFQEYSLQWNELKITWSLNGTIVRSFDLDRILDNFYKEKVQPFDKKFYLAIRLQVFKLSTDEVVFDKNFYENWKCPTLLIDYVRIYQDRPNSTENYLSSSNSTREDLCTKINQKLKLIYSKSYFSASVIWITLLVVCILVIVVGTTLFVLAKRMRKPIDDPEPTEDYDFYGYQFDASKMTDYATPDYDYSVPNTQGENGYVTTDHNQSNKQQQSDAGYVEIH